MLKLNLKSPKKIEIHLSFTLKQQKHPWDLLAEKAKAKQLEETARTHEVSAKHSRKNLFSFKEEPSNQLSQILITYQEMRPEQNIDGNEQMFGEPEVLAEGVFFVQLVPAGLLIKKT